MKKPKDTQKADETKPPKIGSTVLLSTNKFGVLGKDLSSKFSSRGKGTWRPTKPGGRNGQGKP